MINLLKKIFGVHSPSKTIRKENEKAGLWIAEGIKKGVEYGEKYPYIIGIDIAIGESFTSPRTFNKK